MRDISRIPKMLEVIQKIWERQPDTRFNQLVENLQDEYNYIRDGRYVKELWEKEEHVNGLLTAYHKHHIIDLYFVEDDDFLIFLQNKLKEQDNLK